MGSCNMFSRVYHKKTGNKSCSLIARLLRYCDVKHLLRYFSRNKEVVGFCTEKEKRFLERQEGGAA